MVALMRSWLQWWTVLPRAQCLVDAPSTPLRSTDALMHVESFDLISRTSRDGMLCEKQGGEKRRSGGEALGQC